MKVYSIGREQSCDIVIEDNTDIISRRHILLNVYPSGKMTIIDQSQNGTYVNGMRIASHVPVPVTRKDNVSLAHVTRLDWNRVPKPVPVMRYVIIGVVALIIIAAAAFAYYYLTEGKGDGSRNGLYQQPNEEELADSIANAPEQVPGDDGTEEATQVESKKSEAKKKASAKKQEESAAVQSSGSGNAQENSSGAAAEQAAQEAGKEAAQESGKEAEPAEKSTAEPAAEKTDTVKRATRLGL